MHPDSERVARILTNLFVCHVRAHMIRAELEYFAVSDRRFVSIPRSYTLVSNCHCLEDPMTLFDSVHCTDNSLWYLQW